AVASALAWRLPLDPRLAPFLAFAGALAAAAAAAGWIAALPGSDPFAVLRALPVGVGTVWSARFASACAVTAGLLALHLAAHAGTDPALHWTPALRFQLASTVAAAILIGTLGANYGVTLFPRSDHAQRMLSVT